MWSVVIKISELRCCHGNQRNSTAISIWQLKQVLWLMWSQLRKCDNVSKMGSCSPKHLWVKIMKLENMWEEMEVLVKNWEGLYFSLLL